jgi:mRNA interferase MazF
VVVPIADKFDSSGNKILDGQVLLGNIITISKARLDSYVTNLTKSEMKDIDEAIAKSIDIYYLIQKYTRIIDGQEKHIENLKNTIETLQREIEELKKN